MWNVLKANSKDTNDVDVVSSLLILNKFQIFF